MPKETNKTRNSSRSAVTKSEYLSGAPDLESSLAPAPSLLDTSEQVPLCAYYAAGTESTSGNSDLKKKLLNRSRAKFVTGLVSVPLSRLRSPLQKAYKLTESCSAELTETPGKLSGLYCGCRWCLVCSRIRTARLITGYMPAIEQMGEKWFLTLSRPNVPGKQLKAEVKYYLKTASLINRFLREKTIFKRNKDNSQPKFSSLRKIECTYNEESDTYHPHFHFIFDSELAAEIFLDQWLSRNPTALLNKGNQLKKADNNSVLELFKYFTKVVSKSKTGKKTAQGKDGVDYRIHLAALDTMFCALQAVRTFQPCGVIKAVSEEIEPESALETGRAEVNFWSWMGSDWVNTETAAALTGYAPSEGIQDIINHIVYPAGVAVVAEPAAPLTAYYVDKSTGEIVPNESAHLVATSFDFARVHPAPAHEVNEKTAFPEVDGSAYFAPVQDSAPLIKRGPTMSLHELRAAGLPARSPLAVPLRPKEKGSESAALPPAPVLWQSTLFPDLVAYVRPKGGLASRPDWASTRPI